MTHNIHKEKLKELTETINDKKSLCNITYVLLNNDEKCDWAKEKLHDRVIISNYRIICSGHSFPLYFSFDNSKEKEFSANGSMYITIGSIADKNNEKVMQNMLEYLQNEVINRKDEGSCFIYSIDGLNKSNLLSLPYQKK